jgi:hypothetical protein
VTSTIGLIPIVLLWRVFPFDFSGYAYDWTGVVRVLFVVAVVGCCLSILVQMITLIRLAVTHGRPARR